MVESLIERITMVTTGIGLLGTLFFGGTYSGGEMMSSIASVVGLGGIARQAFVVSLVLFGASAYVLVQVSEEVSTPE